MTRVFNSFNSYCRLSSEATPSKNVGDGEDTLVNRASSLVEVNSDMDSDAASSSSSPGSGIGGKKMMERTESLVSDVLSFYSMDGDDRASSKVSFGGLTSPQSFRSQSPSSGQYETAEDGGLTSGGYASSPVSSSSRYMVARWL